MQITGTTQTLPLIGHPVDQVRSPPGFNDYFQSRSIDAVMFPVDVVPAGVASFFKLLRSWENCIGCSVTVPHKRLAATLVDALTPRAARVGSVNIVRRNQDGTLIGDMTDGEAMCIALAQSGFRIEGKRVAVVGAAGGAGSAIADAIAQSGPSALAAIDIDLDRLRTFLPLLREGCGDVVIGDTMPLDFHPDLVIDATGSAMHGNGNSSINVSALLPATWVADLVTKPALTPLLLEARQRGLRILDGLAMADAQINPQSAFLLVAALG